MTSDFVGIGDDVSVVRVRSTWPNRCEVIIPELIILPGLPGQVNSHVDARTGAYICS